MGASMETSTAPFVSPPRKISLLTSMEASTASVEAPTTSMEGSNIAMVASTTSMEIMVASMGAVESFNFQWDWKLPQMLPVEASVKASSSAPPEAFKEMRSLPRASMTCYVVPRSSTYVQSLSSNLTYLYSLQIWTSTRLHVLSQINVHVFLRS